MVLARRDDSAVNANNGIAKITNTEQSTSIDGSEFDHNLEKSNLFSNQNN